MAPACESESVSIDPTAGRVVPLPLDSPSGARCVADAAHASEPAQRRVVPHAAVEPRLRIPDHGVDIG